MTEYRKFVLSVLNPEVQGDDLLLNAAMGLAGESGEVIDLVKKLSFQGKVFKKEDMVKELGDVRYYLELAAHYLDISMEEIEAKNVEKLKARYPDGFKPRN